jgi:tetratricopeptide (TPR) repeat protein
MASGMRVNDRVDEGLAALAEAQPLAEQSGLALELARLHHLRGNLYFPLGRIDDCLSEHQASLTYARAAGSVEAEATALGGLGDAYYLQGRLRSAHEQFVRCVELAREHGLAKLEVNVLHMVGWSAEYLLMARSAVETGLQGVALAERLADPRAAMLSHSLVAELATRALGDIELAAAHTVRARELAEKLGAGRFVAQSFVIEASMALVRGDKERARLLVREGLTDLGEAGQRHTGARLYGLLARATASSLERCEALREGEALLDAGTPSHNHLHFAESAIAALLEQGDWAGAERQCERLERYCAREPLPWSEFVIARGRAFARLGRGERNDALRETLERLRETAARAELHVALPDIDAAVAASARG